MGCSDSQLTYSQLAYHGREGKTGLPESLYAPTRRRLLPSNASFSLCLNAVQGAAYTGVGLAPQLVLPANALQSHQKE